MKSGTTAASVHWIYRSSNGTESRYSRLSQPILKLLLDWRDSGSSSYNLMRIGIFFDFVIILALCGIDLVGILVIVSYASRPTNITLLATRMLMAQIILASSVSGETNPLDVYIRVIPFI